MLGAAPLEQPDAARADSIVMSAAAFRREGQAHLQTVFGSALFALWEDEGHRQALKRWKVSWRSLLLMLRSTSANTPALGDLGQVPMPMGDAADPDVATPLLEIPAVPAEPKGYMRTEYFEVEMPKQEEK